MNTRHWIAAAALLAQVAPANAANVPHAGEIMMMGSGYCPAGWSVAKWTEMREKDPQAVVTAALQSMARHVEAMLAFQKMGIPTFDYGNNIRQEALDTGVTHAFDFPGFVPAYVRPLFCRGIGPFRWVALSGDPEDIYRTDQRRPARQRRRDPPRDGRARHPSRRGHRPNFSA